MEKWPKFARFWRKLTKNHQIFMVSCSSSQEHRRILFFSFVLSYLVCNQIWLNYFVDDRHFDYIIKSLKETLLSSVFFNFFILKILQNLTKKISKINWICTKIRKKSTKIPISLSINSEISPGKKTVLLSIECMPLTKTKTRKTKNKKN